MKIAISSKGGSLESEVDARFGRCPYFIIVEIQKGEIKSSKALKNTATAHQRGAGPTAAELVANQGVKTVITQNIGPRAVSAMKKLGIKVYKSSGLIKEVVQEFISGELKEMTGTSSGCAK
ncbi:hypothetical protein GF352_00215 [archaeon]|nr:hypothetical protein [archaeon]